MTRFLMFFTIALSLASAVLAFLTKEKAGEVTSKLASVSQRVSALGADNAKLKDDKKAVETNAEALEKSIAAQKQEVEKLQADAAAKQAEASKSQADLLAAKAKAAELEKKLQEAPPPAPAPVADPALEQEKIALRAELEKAQKALVEEQKLAAQRLKEAEAKAALASAKSKADTAKGPAGKAAAEGRVVAYNAGWNFVVVNLGDRQGVTPESQLEIVRQGAVLAFLDITEVQPKFASASIRYPLGARKDGEVRPGDVVRFSPKEEGAEPSSEVLSYSAGSLPVQGNAEPLP